MTRAKGASDVTVDALIAKRLEKIQAAHPEVKFTKVDTQVDSEVGNYHSTMETLIEGAALAIVVVFIFLRDMRATLVTAIALPLSVIPTFWAMDAIGFSLNLVSLLAITLVTGILVDDAIVEIENIVRHMRMGKSAYRASLEAADEIGLAVIAISLSIAAIFSPVSRPTTMAALCWRSSCRPDRASTTPIASPARSRTNCAPCPRFVRRSFSGASSWEGRTTSRARRRSSSISSTSRSARRPSRTCS